MMMRLASRHAGVVRRLVHANKACSQTFVSQRRQFSQLDFVDADQSAHDNAVREFIAEPRTVDGSRACARLREQGFVPGIVYGVDSNGKDRRLLVQLQQSQLQRELNNLGRAIENTIYTVRVGDETFKAVPRNLQQHPTKEIPNSVNFLCHNPSKKLRVKIPLEFFNLEKCTGLKQGGRLEIAQRDLHCTVKSDFIPRNIRINMAGYSIGERVRVEQVECPEGVSPLRPLEMVFKITGRRGVKV